MESINEMWRRCGIGIGGNPLYPRELCLDLEDGIARLKGVKDGS